MKRFQQIHKYLQLFLLGLSLFIGVAAEAKKSEVGDCNASFQSVIPQLPVKVSSPQERVEIIKEIYEQLESQRTQGLDIRRWSVRGDLLQAELEYFKNALEEKLQLTSLSPNPLATEAFTKVLEQIENLSKQEEILYRDFVIAGAQVTLAFESLCCTHPPSARFESHRKALLDDDRLFRVEELHLNDIFMNASEGLFYLPTGMDLGYYEFNRTFSYSLFVLGVRDQRETADGLNRSPLNFWEHDYFHSRNTWIFQMRSRSYQEDVLRLRAVGEKIFLRIENHPLYNERYENRLLEGSFFYGLHEANYRKMRGFPRDVFLHLNQSLRDRTEIQNLKARFGNSRDMGATLHRAFNSKDLDRNLGFLLEILDTKDR